MTPRQVYSALANIAGHRCYDHKKFVVSGRLGREHVEILQKRIAALLEKMDYDRCRNDFPELYMDDSMPTGIRSSRLPPPGAYTYTGMAPGPQFISPQTRWTLAEANGMPVDTNLGLPSAAELWERSFTVEDPRPEF